MWPSDDKAHQLSYRGKVGNESKKKTVQLLMQENKLSKQELVRQVYFRSRDAIWKTVWTEHLVAAGYSHLRDSWNEWKRTHAYAYDVSKHVDEAHVSNHLSLRQLERLVHDIMTDTIRNDFVEFTSSYPYAEDVEMEYSFV